MDAFFQRLLAEADPTRIATMAEAMPDPPDLAGIAAAILEPSNEPFDVLQVRLVDRPAEAAARDARRRGHGRSGRRPGRRGRGRRWQLAWTSRPPRPRPLAFSDDIDGDGTAPAASSGQDEIVVSAEVGAVKLANADAGSLPMLPEGERAKTRVVVVGLVSVASIATFKRGLSRSAGVAGVGVASGPDGEFVFTVDHDPSQDLSAAVTALPGFDAHITSQSDGTIEVTAHDPDTGD